MTREEKISGSNNLVQISEKINYTLNINGNNNKIIIKNAQVPTRVDVFIHGDYNEILIEEMIMIRSMNISMGNHVRANRTCLKIGKNFSCEKANLLLYNDNSKLFIGDNCMFSTGITVRCGESPHLIFDDISKKYLDVTEGVFIGNHVWVGENVYITKKVTIPDESVVAAGGGCNKKILGK